MAYFNKRYSPPGTPAGTLSAATQPPRFTLAVVQYDADEVHEYRPQSLRECAAFLAKPQSTWIHVQGDVGPETLHQLGEMFGLHPLALEDVLNTGQRPKMEIYEQQLFVVMGMPQLQDGAVKLDQFSAFAGPHFLVTFHTGAEDPFGEVRKRLQVSGNRVRQHPADYLLYALIDVAVDHGFPLLESFGDQVQTLEDDVLERPTSARTVRRLHHLRRELVLLRRTLWPQREVVNALLREESTLVSRETRIYLRDCYDHTVQLMDLLESYRDVLASLLDVYYSSLSTRMNDIMRVLTVIATIFIPLTFIVGLYGMNFSNPQSPWAMPELHWYYGYPLVLGIMGVVALGMLYYFRRKRWL